MKQTKRKLGLIVFIGYVVAVAIIFAIFLCSCQTTTQTHKVFYDTTKIVWLDTFRVNIIDTLRIEKTITKTVYDTLKTHFDSVTIFRYIDSIKVRFRYDTVMLIDDASFYLKMSYDDSLSIFINIIDVKSIDNIQKDKVAVEETKWLPSLWIQIGIGSLVGVVLLFWILRKIYGWLGGLFSVKK